MEIALIGTSTKAILEGKAIKLNITIQPEDVGVSALQSVLEKTVHIRIYDNQSELPLMEAEE